MATREMLLSAGVPGQALSRAVAAGVVFRVARGVYATAPPTTWPQRAAAAGAASGGEAVYWRLIVDSGLPVPQLNVPFTTERGNYVLDAWWRDWDLAAEIDGRRHHVDAFEADRVRQNELHAAGLLLIRFPVAQVLGDPQEVLRITELALSQRGWRPTTRRS